MSRQSGGDGTLSRIGMIPIIVGAAALIWICQPSSLIRFDSGEIISGVVAPACARLKRMPRAPRLCMRFSKAVRSGRREPIECLIRYKRTHSLRAARVG